MDARFKHWLVVLFVVVLAFAIPFYLLAEAPKATSTLEVIYTGNTEVDIQYGLNGVDWDTHSARLTAQ